MEKLNIMVADDLRGIRESLKVIFQDDFNIHEAESGYQALETLKTHDIPLVILDILMPGLDGLETLKRIKTLNSAVEVCMLSSISDQRTVAEATQLGAFDFITKPFDVERIRATMLNMERIIRNRRRHDPSRDIILN